MFLRLVCLSCFQNSFHQSRYLVISSSLNPRSFNVLLILFLEDHSSCQNLPAPVLNHIVNRLVNFSFNFLSLAICSKIDLPLSSFLSKSNLAISFGSFISALSPNPPTLLAKLSIWRITSSSGFSGST